MVYIKAEAVIRQHPSGLSKIHLNRPTKLNAISFNMCDIISQAVLVRVEEIYV